MELGQVDPERLVRCSLRKPLLLYFCLKQQMSAYLVEMLYCPQQPGVWCLFLKGSFSLVASILA
jgi:hypothetical protein